MYRNGRRTGTPRTIIVTARSGIRSGPSAASTRFCGAGPGTMDLWACAQRIGATANRRTGTTTSGTAVRRLREPLRQETLGPPYNVIARLYTRRFGAFRKLLSTRPLARHCVVAPASLQLSKLIHSPRLVDPTWYFAHASYLNRRHIEARVQRTQLRWMVARLDGCALQFNKRSTKDERDYNTGTAINLDQPDKLG